MPVLVQLCGDTEVESHAIAGAVESARSVEQLILVVGVVDAAGAGKLECVTSGRIVDGELRIDASVQHVGRAQQMQSCVHPPTACVESLADHQPHGRDVVALDLQPIVTTRCDCDVVVLLVQELRRVVVEVEAIVGPPESTDMPVAFRDA